jgi:hypothetical protein
VEVLVAKSKLNKNAQKWVRALRSGKYKQGPEYLCADGKFCCLGVVCELAIKADVQVKKSETEEDGVRYNKQACVLPTKVMKWVGLKDDEGRFAEGYEMLTALNDSGKSFKQIARIIESKPKGLFVD